MQKRKKDVRTYWLVFKVTGLYAMRHWDFKGVFSTKERAIVACRDETYMIAPATLNESLPDGTFPEWEGSYYSKA